MTVAKIFMIVFSVASLTRVVYSQGDCDKITINLLGNTTGFGSNGFISDILSPGGEVTLRPEVFVLDMNIVCEAQSQLQNKYRYTSVVVSFRCDSSDVRVTACQDNTVVVTQQFDFGCSTMHSSWVTNILSVTNDPTPTPIATLSTAADTDCFVCINPNNTAVAALSLIVTADTHCEKCNSGCLTPDTLQRCYETTGSQQCCRYFFEGSCQESCTAPLVPTNTFVCGCTVLDEPNGNFAYTDGQAVGSNATLTCDTNFEISGSSITCQSIGWSGTPASCDPVCADIITNCDTCEATGSTVTCTQCTGGQFVTSTGVCSDAVGCDTGCIAGIVVVVVLLIVAIVVITVIVIVVLKKKEGKN